MRKFLMQLTKNVGEILIYDEIGLGAIDTKSFKFELDKWSDAKTINIHINSPGGSVFEGFAIYNLLKAHKATKNVYIDGYAGSISSVIAMAGDTVKMYENTYLFVHRPFAYTQGDAEEMQKTANMLLQLESNAVKIYSQKATKTTENDIRQMLKDATWISANDAVKLGFADEILEAKEIDNLLCSDKYSIPQNISFKILQLQYFDPQNPYPNEHAARIIDPSEFETEKNSWGTKEIAPGIRIILGKLKITGKWETQAYRFNKDKFTSEEAKKWLEDHKIKYISFEPASNSKDFFIPNILNFLQGVNKMKKCPKCGKDVSNEFEFCNHCGANMKSDPMKEAHDREILEAKNLGIQEESLRVSEIYSRCSKFSLPQDFAAKLVSDKVSLHDAISKILDKISESKNFDTIWPNIQFGTDEKDKFKDGCVNSLCVAANLEKDPVKIVEARKSDMPQSLHGLVKGFLRQEGKVSSNRIDNMLPHDIAAHAFRLSAIGTSDLPSVLADVGNKSLQKGFTEAPTTFDIWGSSMDVPDFKSVKLIKMSNFSNVDKIPEGMAFKFGKFSDKQETVSISTSGKACSISRQAFINNDLRTFTIVPQALMGSVKRGINKDFYDVLCSNSLLGPVMTEVASDGNTKNLFEATYHTNYTASGSVPSVAAIAALERKIMDTVAIPPEKNTDADPLNIPAKWLITGTANKLIAEQLLLGYSVYATTVTDVNTVRGKITPVTDAYLQKLLTAASKQYAWYLAVDQNQLETIGVAYLQGNRVPTMRSETSQISEALGITFDIYFDSGIYVADYRGIALNAGQ